MFCPKCGKNIPDGAQFCPKCGNAVKQPEPAPAKPKVDLQPQRSSANQSSPPPRSQSAPQKKGGYLAQEDGVCPNCGSRDCEIQVQDNVTTSGSNYGCCSGGLGYLCLGPFGLLCGLCGSGKTTSTTHRSVWVCKGCGNQFPTKQERFNGFVAMMGVCCFFVPMIVGMSLVFLPVGAPTVTLAFCAVAALIACFGLKGYRNALGNYSLKDAVSSGILTEQQRKTLLTSSLVLLVSGALVGASLFVLIPYV